MKLENFLNAIIETPESFFQWHVLADYFEEQGDENCFKLRNYIEAVTKKYEICDKCTNHHGYLMEDKTTNIWCKHLNRYCQHLNPVAKYRLTHLQTETNIPKRYKKIISEKGYITFFDVCLDQPAVCNYIVQEELSKILELPIEIIHKRQFYGYLNYKNKIFNNPLLKKCINIIKDNYLYHDMWDGSCCRLNQFNSNYQEATCVTK